jgi:phosphoglycerate dehydrogenase-like enzyme
MNGMAYQKAEYLERRLVPVWEALKPKAPQVVMEPYAREVVLGEDGRDPDTGITYPISDADAILVRSATKVDAEAIAAASRLKVVARAGVGLDTLDDQVIRIYGRPGEAWRRLRVELEALLGPGR